MEANMRIFDLHADLGFDIHEKYKKGERNVLQNRHNERVFKGEVTSIAMASYFEGFQNWDEMKAMILDCENELNNQDVWHKVLTREDLKVDKPLALMSVEGMCGIKENEEEAVEWMYEHGIRLASLCWNDENALATGVKGTPERGLTEKGKNLIRKMNEMHMVIDVSHTNEKTFWDIMETSNGLVIATAGMILTEHKIAIDPIDQDSVSVFRAAGYRVIESSQFNISMIK